MRQIFVDTWHLFTLTHKGDMYHKKAIAIASRPGSTNLITSEGLLTEYLNLFQQVLKILERQQSP
jgi:predicted nucleic acid-binding protein